MILFFRKRQIISTPFGATQKRKINAFSIYNMCTDRSFPLRAHALLDSSSTKREANATGAYKVHFSIRSYASGYVSRAKIRPRETPISAIIDNGDRHIVVNCFQMCERDCTLKSSEQTVFVSIRLDMKRNGYACVFISKPVKVPDILNFVVAFVNVLDFRIAFAE